MSEGAAWWRWRTTRRAQGVGDPHCKKPAPVWVGPAQESLRQAMIARCRRKLQTARRRRRPQRPAAGRAALRVASPHPSAPRSRACPMASRPAWPVCSWTAGAAANSSAGPIGRRCACRCGRRWRCAERTARTRCGGWPGWRRPRHHASQSGATDINTLSIDRYRSIDWRHQWQRLITPPEAPPDCDPDSKTAR